MRPVSNAFPASQGFASYATAGVIGNARGTTVQQLVAMYGNYQPHGHAGEDIACPVGTPVYAMADGVVLYAGWAEDLPGDDSWSSSGYFRRWALYRFFPGIVTVIQHPWGVGIYAHLSNNDMAPKGTRVKEGQLIALSGNTSSRKTRLGAHLHVEAVVDLSYRTGGGLIYGRTNPARFYGSIAPQAGAITPTPAPTPPPEEEDDKLLIIGKVPGDDRVWVGDGATKRHIPNPKVLASYVWYAKNGWLKIKDDGAIQTLDWDALEALGIDVTNLLAVTRKENQLHEEYTREVLGKQIAATSAVDVAGLIPDDLAQDVVDELVERLKAK